MSRLVAVAVLVLSLLAVASPVLAADPPQIIEGGADVDRDVQGSLPITITPSPFALLGVGSYTGRITMVPISDLAILPHGQVEQSRFDLQWTGPLALVEGGVPLAILTNADTEVLENSGHVIVHLDRPLPHSDLQNIIGIPYPIPLTPYSVSITVDEPVLVESAFLPVEGPVTHLQLTKGELLFIK